MLLLVKKMLLQQFGASLDMLENAIKMWPDELWHSERKAYRMSYHTLIFLEYYLSFPASFKVRLPYQLMDEVPEGELDDLVPARDYSKQEILGYLQHCRTRLHEVIEGLTEDTIGQHWINESGYMDYPRLELLLYNMRHVQHHAAQMNMMLRNRINNAPDWVSREGDTR